jgi:hypothetical protein
MALIRSKFAFKKFAGKCAFCDEKDYAVLDIHRIFEGYKGGIYDSRNCVCVCANHHRKIHDDQIKIIKKHISYGENQYVLEYMEQDETKYLPINY